ncbi:MAG: hypothetical protein ABI600_12145 [Luteolibacter sp.]
MNDDLLPINPANFLKMAHGDISGLKQLAFDFFNDTRLRMTGWLSLIETGNLTHFRDDLHRCKGGASLFGLERVVALIGSCESPAVIESSGFDLIMFEKELTAAEQAVAALAD